MLLDEKADQWNSTGSLEIDPNTNNKLACDKVACHINRQKMDYSWH